MLCKIKSTLNFVKLWPTLERREITPFVIISENHIQANDDISKVIKNWIDVETKDGVVVYQCYLQNVVTEEIYQASVFPISTAEVVLDDAAVLDYIINNKVQLEPTTAAWVTDTGEPATFVTHDVIIGNTEYQGMSVQDCINKHVNAK